MTAADDDDFSIDSDDSYVANLTATLNIGHEDNETGGVLNFDLAFVFNVSTSRNQYGDHGSVCTFEVCEQTTQKESEATSKKRTNKQTISTQKAASSNQPTGNEALEQMMSNHPDLVCQFLSNNPQMFQ
jgi:hypothetical protein